MGKVSEGKDTRGSAALMPEGMMTFNRDALDAYSQAWGSYVEAWNRCGHELMEFAASRMRKDTELGESLMRCRTWNETAEIHRHWMQSALDDYAREGEKVMEIMSVAAREKVDTPPRGAARKATRAGAHAQSSDA